MTKKVLAVDDDPMIRGLIKEMLTAEGYEVVLAENGPDGISTLLSDNFASELCLIVLDVIMPGLTGLEVLSKIKEDELAPNVPVIMLTGEANPEDVLAGYNRGADYYITKPFTRQQLLHGIDLVKGE